MFLTQEAVKDLYIMSLYTRQQSFSSECTVEEGIYVTKRTMQH